MITWSAEGTARLWEAFALPRLAPEAAAAMRHIARFVAESLGDNVINLQAG